MSALEEDGPTETITTNSTATATATPSSTLSGNPSATTTEIIQVTSSAGHLTVQRTALSLLQLFVAFAGFII